MVSMSGLHALTSEMHAGFLTLAFACIIVVVAAQIVVRLRNWLPKWMTNLAIRVRGYAEAAGYVGALLGVIGLLLSAYTGMYAWPQDVLLESSIIRNKILLTAFSTILWSGAVFIRVRFGRGLWTCPAMAVVYVGLASAGYSLLAIAGCLGSRLARDESLLDWIYAFIGLDVEKEFALDPSVAAAIAIGSALAFLVSLFVAKRYDLFSIKLGPQTCQKFFRWDEPRIVELTHKMD